MNALGPREVASATGVSTSTLRHYERLGLLGKVHRTAAGYRRYPPGAVERVLLIQRALVVGLSLPDVKRILKARDGGCAPCASVRALVASRLDTLTQHIADLRVLRKQLQAVLADWDRRLSRTPGGQPARLLEQLQSHRGIDQRRGQRPARQTSWPTTRRRPSSNDQ